VTPISHWLSSDGGLRLRECQQAADILGQLLALYRRGLSTPLHFFPRAAWAYVESDGALGKARAVWQDAGPGYPPECADVAYRQALRGVDQPLDGEFERCAQIVFGPLRAHAEELSA
jgi:exodeoxyribonuclease V gamma subunit